MAKDLYIPVTLRGGRIDCKASLGQTVIKTVAPETYTGPTTVTPSESQQTLQTKDKMLTNNVTVNPIPSEYIIPTGTEVINVTENGIVSRDISAKETVTVNTNVPIPPGYIIPTGNLGITENGQYDVIEKASVTVDVPAPTGTKEISIMENGEKTVDVSGFALAHILTSVPTPQGGLEYEEGTYTPSTDEIPTISFAKSHNKAPDIIIFADVSAEASATGNTLTSFTYVNVSAIFENPLQYTASISWGTFYAYTRMASNLNGASGAALYNRGNVAANGFEPFAGSTAFICRQGQTYKWIAIWK